MQRAHRLQATVGRNTLAKVWGGLLAGFPDTFYYFDSWSESRRPFLRVRGEREVAYVARSLTHNNIRDLQGKATVSIICYDHTPHTVSDVPWVLSIPYNIHAPRNHIGLFDFPHDLCPMANAAAPSLVFVFQGQLNQLWCLPISETELPTADILAQDNSGKSRVLRAYMFERYSDASGRLNTKKMPNSIEIRDGPGSSPRCRFSVAIENPTGPSRDVSQASTRAGQNVVYSAGHTLISFSCEPVRDQT